jgi:hypothetical protein
MVIEGVVAVQGRISEIRQRMQAIDTAMTPSAAGFEAVLARAVQGERAAAATRTVGRVPPPAELERFGNGTIPLAALTPIGPGHRLWAPAARAYTDMAAAAKAAGVHLRVTDSYRSFDAQVDVAQRKGLYSEGGLAAKPGTSTHGWGLSIDVDPTPAALAWLRAYAGQFGFVEDVPREPWHWTYRPGVGPGAAT